MPRIKKSDFPVAEIRRFLEPGPVVLVSSAHRGERNIMTMGWHTVMEFVPSLVGCVISGANYSYQLISLSKECVINIPTAGLARTVARIGNCSGRQVDKFEQFKLTAAPAEKVGAPLIVKCYANLECKLHDGLMVGKYNFFIFEVIKAQAARAPKYPKTIHYRGGGQFMVSGQALDLKMLFRSEML
jgi:flavin reductase (DIM6/NTAB) family NADH-FMN oxidoreductase RutF